MSTVLKSLIKAGDDATGVVTIAGKTDGTIAALTKVTSSLTKLKTLDGILSNPSSSMYARISATVSANVEAKTFKLAMKSLNDAAASDASVLPESKGIIKTATDSASTMNVPSLSNKIAMSSGIVNSEGKFTKSFKIGSAISGGVTAGISGVVAANMLLIEGATFTIKSIDSLTLSATDPLSTILKDTGGYLTVTYDPKSVSKGKTIQLIEGDTVDFVFPPNDTSIYNSVKGLSIFNAISGDPTSSLVVLKSAMNPKTANVYSCSNDSTSSVSCGSSTTMISHTDFIGQLGQFGNPNYLPALETNNPVGSLLDPLTNAVGSFLNKLIFVGMCVAFAVVCIAILWILYKVKSIIYPATTNITVTSAPAQPISPVPSASSAFGKSAVRTFGSIKRKTKRPCMYR
jgi:hypothetical protein